MLKSIDSVHIIYNKYKYIYIYIYNIKISSNFLNRRNPSDFLREHKEIELMFAQFKHQLQKRRIKKRQKF